MRCLFVGPLDQDYLGSCLWDGLQEVLGEENVVDAVGSPWLHRSSCDRLCNDESMQRLASPPIMREVGASREGMTLTDLSGDFDLIVLISSFERQHDWPWLMARMLTRLRHDGKIAYVEGWDAAWDIRPPRTRVDAVFRKEISNRVSYPYLPHHLTFAMPSRMFVETADGERPCDVFWSGNPEACHPHHPVRWPMLGRVFHTRQHHRSVIATTALGWPVYWGLLRTSKLALCPSGADDTDAMRTYEAVACGAIPVFVGYPDHVRDPWFPPETCFNCTVDTLAEHLDEALGNDQSRRRRLLLAHAREYHTTRVRANKILSVLGVKP